MWTVSAGRKRQRRRKGKSLIVREEEMFTHRADDLCDLFPRDDLDLAGKIYS